MFGLEHLLVGRLERVLASILVVLLCLAIASVAQVARRRLRARVRAVWLDIVASSVVAAVVIAGTLVIADLWGRTDVLLDELGFLRLDQQAPELLITVVILIAIQVLAGSARRLLDDLVEEDGTITAHQREMGVRLSQLAVWGIGIIVILGVWDIDLTGVLVGAGFLGIVVGLAARKTIGSLVAGLVLMFSRPFEVGDWILVDDHEGVVTDITLLSTRVLAANGERVVVPNDVVTGEIVINRTREGRFRVDAEVGVDYDDDLGTAVDVAESTAREVAASSEAVLREPAPSVVVHAFGDSAVMLTVRVWVATPDRRRVTEVRHTLVEALKDEFDASGLTIPYPQRELSARDGTAAPSVPNAELDVPPE